MKRAHWGSRLSFILAASGSAIGLGNIWKFPYITGVNGGGAFVLIYLLCIFLVGLPIFLAELYIGQKSQANAVQAFEAMHRPLTPWRVAGFLGVLSAFLILSFYSVVGGWILDFLRLAVMGTFTSGPAEENGKILGVVFASPWRQLLFHSIFTAMTLGIVMGGVKAGLERFNKVLMPGLALLLVFLLVRSFFLPGFGQALEFLFSPDTSKLTAGGVLEAVGHSFFTLSLGMGCIITYGSYLDEKENLGRTALTVAMLDTVIALTAGLIIFSVVFSFGLEASGGPGLIFSTLPVLFGQMTGGTLVASAFFLLVAFAALTSAVSILEVSVAFFTETYGWKRKPATLGLGLICFLAGVLTVLSTNEWQDVTILGMTFFDLFDTLTSSYFLPFGGMVISLFFGWVLGLTAIKQAVPEAPPWAQTGLLWTVRGFAPAMVLIILLNKAFDFI